MYIDKAEIEQLEKQKRVHLINSLGGFKSVALVGTADENKKTNLAIFSSIFHIGANPPLIGMIFRPSPPERDTMRNILETGFYTINHINENIYKQAHQTSARYDKDISEFDVTGLKPVYKNNFFAPFVSESHLQLGIDFKEKIDISNSGKSVSYDTGDVELLGQDTNENYNYHILSKETGTPIQVSKEDFLKAGSSKGMRPEKLMIDHQNKKVIAKFENFKKFNR
jgi:flavin reductase (DIM6/NTAB) family NADH-FMN oxidoreductase RutF